jgi:glycerol-3-phosphate acyltransferase PlsY
MLNALLLMIGSYFIAAMPFGYWTGKVLKGIDVREHGSGSTGATNVFRTVGKPAGVFVFFTDVFKGVIPVLIAKYMEAHGAFTGMTMVPPEIMPAIVSVICLVAHSKSIFLKWQGGKSAATGLGTLFALNPLGGLFTFITWLTVMFVTKYVSVASIGAVAMCGVYFWLLHSPPADVLYCFFGFVYVTYRHKSNIQRLLKGTEPKIGQKKSETDTAKAG